MSDLPYRPRPKAPAPDWLRSQPETELSTVEAYRRGFIPPDVERPPTRAYVPPPLPRWKRWAQKVLAIVWPIIGLAAALALVAGLFYGGTLLLIWAVT